MLELPRQHVACLPSYENTTGSPFSLSLFLCLYRNITSIVLPVWNILIEEVLNVLLLQMAQGHSNYNGDHPGPSSV
jgi:hypothetical protein